MPRLDDALKLVYVVDEIVAADEAMLARLLDAGVSTLWLRMPEARGRRIFEVAEALRRLTLRHGGALVVGDRADVATAVGADGVQVGHRAPPPEAIRTQVRGWLGVSCHDRPALERAVQAGANYAMLSPVRAVPGKGAPIGREGFRMLRSGIPIPVVALGGIDVDIGAALREDGADGLAVIRALRDAPDPVAAAARLSGRMTSP